VHIIQPDDHLWETRKDKQNQLILSSQGTCSCRAKKKQKGKKKKKAGGIADTLSSIYRQHMASPDLKLRKKDATGIYRKSDRARQQRVSGRK